LIRCFSPQILICKNYFYHLHAVALSRHLNNLWFVIPIHHRAAA